MQKTIDILGELEAREAGLTYEQYLAQMQRYTKQEAEVKVMAASVGR
jgi:hypothetical protein